MRKKKNFWLGTTSNPWSVTIVGGIAVLLIQQFFFSDTPLRNVTFADFEAQTPIDTPVKAQPFTPEISKATGRGRLKNERSVPPEPSIVPDTATILKPEKYTYNFTVVIQHDRWLNAKIFVDSQWVANAPNTILLTAGRHHLRVEASCGLYEEMVLIPEQSLVNIPKSQFSSH